MKRKVWSAILILLLLGGSFGTAIATYPASAVAALTDPWDAINQLFAKIAELERRIINIEKLLRGPDDDTLDYLYSANLAPELIGKVEARYGWTFITESDWDEVREEYKPPTVQSIRYDLEIRNLSNQTIKKFQYDIIVRDSDGNIIMDGSDIIVEESFSSDQGYTFTTLRESPIYTEIKPGSSYVVWNGMFDIKTALVKAGIDLSDPKITVEIAITSVKFV